MLGKLKISVLIAISLAFFWGISYGVESTECMDCHDETHNEIHKSYGESVGRSIHAEFECVDCHVEIEEIPHEEDLSPVDCGSCHEDAAEIYIAHGRHILEEDEDIPRCNDCHGKHDILPADDKLSKVNPINLPTTCGFCHEDIDMTQKHEILYGKAVEIYTSSVHGKASLGGVYVAATCNDCHSTGGTAHRILGPGSSESSINHFNIPKTCGQCHSNTEKDFWEGVHGKLVSRGETDAPVCTDCHGEHGIISPSDPKSRVSPARVAEATCSPCHESARLNEKYGTPKERLRSWVDSYHGLKSKAGDMTVANCSSCHGAHRILPHTDSTSSIHAGKLRETCGHCHPGISAELANTPIHGMPGVSQTKMANIVSQLYIILIAVVIGLMVIHWLVDILKKIRGVIRKKPIRRMTLNELWQHTMLMVTFTSLVISGFALRFYDAFWVNFLFGWEGGFPVRGIIHRISAVLFIISVVWHIIYLTTPKGRKFLKDMMPEWSDLTKFLNMFKFNLGIVKERPLFGRFSYVEKAEYWALVWGTAIMIFTGFFLWFEDYAIVLFPKGFLDVMLVIHYYEAWLATLAILVWHLYSTVFNPDVYPMNPAWLSGKMPEDMYRHEHPEDPIFKKEDNQIVDKDKL